MMTQQSLNTEQQRAVEHVEGPLLVLAGAGSGKTRVVTQRIGRLIERGIEPQRILAVTFTNKAAQEMRERVQTLVRQSVYVTTFHSLGARILRESIHALGYETDFVIYDEEDAEKVVKAILKEIGREEKKWVKSARKFISRHKNAMQLPEDLREGQLNTADERLLALVYQRYQAKLKEYNAVDFDDLLLLTVRLFREHAEVLESYQRRWRYVLVDEYQDTNAAQYEMMSRLVAPENNLFVVGDPDQSIYSWRGADIQNILSFEADFPGAQVVLLEHNYRSTTNILEAANHLVSHNGDRYEKNLWSTLGSGQPITLFDGETDRDEAEFVVREVLRARVEEGIPLKDMAVFYRTNFQSRVFEDLLLSEGVPYVVVGGVSFYQRREIKDILAYLRMVQSDADYVSFLRTINLPKRGLGPTTVERLRMGAETEGVGILTYSRKVLADGSVRLNKRQKEGLQDYLGIIDELRQLRDEASLSELVRLTQFRTRYLHYLKEDPETAEDRQANVDELVAKAQEWELSVENPTLDAFLEELSLKASLDDAEMERDRLALMTVHNSKGLEYDVVFLVGLEEDLFPHVNSRDSLTALEEERRLCYVGMTRARKHLFLSHVRFRRLWGQERMMIASRFLREIPREYFEAPDEEAAHEEVRYEYDAGCGPEGALSDGSIVMHRQYGIGVVQKVMEGDEGIIYQIYFQNEQRTRLVFADEGVLTPL